MLSLTLFLRPAVHAFKYKSLPSYRFPRHGPIVPCVREYSSAPYPRGPTKKEVVAATKFLLSLRTEVRKGEFHPAFKRVLGALNSSTFHPVLRGRIFELSTRNFLLDRQFCFAADIYNKMVQEGYLPSLSLRIRMYVLNVVSESPTREALLESVKHAYSQPEFDEHCFRDLLYFLWRVLKCDHDILDVAVANYVRMRDSSYPLSDVTERFLSRIRWDTYLQQRPSLKSLPSSVLVIPEDAPSVPASLMYLAKSNFESPARFYAALEPWTRMGAGVRACNALITTQLKFCRYDKAFRVYALMRPDGNPPLVPNITTFKQLFKFYWIPRVPHTVHTRRAKIPDGAPSARQLYHQMLTHVHRHGPSVKESNVSVTSMLDSALRAFMENGDYAAAFVTIGTYKILNAPLTLTAYRIVLHSLLERINSELIDKSSGEDTGSVSPDEEEEDPFPLGESTSQKMAAEWSYRFLNYPKKVPEKLDVRLVMRIMAYGENPHLTSNKTPPDRKKTPEKPSAQPRRVSPFVKQVLFSHDPESLPVKPLCLLRILRRAILAMSGTLYGPPSREVNTTVTYAKAEMIPPRTVKE